MKLSGAFLARWIWSFGIILIAHLSVVFFYFNQVESNPSSGTYFWLHWFFFEYEKNIPALFTTLLMFCIGVCLKRIAETDTIREEGTYRLWKGLQYTVVFLACDEWFSIHEGLNDLGVSSFGVPYWVLIYLGLATVLAVTYIPFMFNLLKKTLYIWLGGAFIYIGGAALFETVNYQIHDFNTIAYQTYLVFEDGLEIMGLLVILWGCLDYMKVRFKDTQFSISKRWAVILTVLMGIEMVITYNI